jgi:hypothetical protein
MNHPELPTPPEGLSATGLGLWASSTVMQACMDRGANPAEMARAMLVMVAAIAVAHEPSNDVLVADFRLALEQARAGSLDN